MSEYLTIQSATETADSQGGAAVAWSDVACVWAELVPLRASERLQAQGMGSTALYRFRVRVRNDVTPSMRVSWTPSGGEVAVAQALEISGVTREVGRSTMLLDCGVRQ
jgi:SPP1 family predicted phage head-tail adaptor